MPRLLLPVGRIEKKKKKKKYNKNKLISISVRLLLAVVVRISSHTTTLSLWLRRQYALVAAGGSVYTVTAYAHCAPASSSRHQ